MLTLPSVSTLLYQSRPMAIVWAVALVIVNAVYGVLRGWARPNISVEVLEGIEPTGADSNTASAVVGKAFVARVLATLLHGRPDVVFRQTSEIVRGIALDQNFAVEAPAALSATANQVAATRDVFAATVATTGPVSAIVVSVGEMQNGQAAELLARQIFYAPGAQRNLLFGHRFLLNDYTGLFAGLQA